MVMFNLLSWWYSAGWADFLHLSGATLANLMDFFSIDLLFKTLFSPFRQISAGSAKSASLDVKFRMFIDRLVSRFIGAIVRTFVIIAGILCIGVVAIINLAFIILWPALPLLPVAGIILTILGVAF